MLHLDKLCHALDTYWLQEVAFRSTYDSVRREVLYKILIEFGIHRKLVRLVKMSLTETYGRVRVGKNVSDRFPIRNGLKQ